MSVLISPVLPRATTEFLVGRDVVKDLMSALEQMFAEFARVKAEVACIAVYDSEALIAGSKKRKKLLGG